MFFKGITFDTCHIVEQKKLPGRLQKQDKSDEGSDGSSKTKDGPIQLDLEASKKRIKDLEVTVSALRRIIETLERERGQRGEDPRQPRGSPSPSTELAIRSDKEVCTDILCVILSIPTLGITKICFPFICSN